MKYTKMNEFKKVNIFGMGIPNFLLAKYMTGKTYLNPVKIAGRAMLLANVTFSPGSRTFWHIHHGTKGGGQILICTAGEGWYQEEGKDPISLVPGMVVNIPTDLLHWHGAKRDSWFSHIAVEIGGENVKNEFVRPVTVGEYNHLLEPEPMEITEGTTTFDRENVFGKGVPNDMYAQYFTGTSFLNPKFKPEKGKPFVANVTFEPGSRNHWHIHKSSAGGGQVLVCTAGEGWYQQEGKKAKTLKPGDTVYIPAGVKHWHGAKISNWFSHLSIEVPGENSSNEWLEPVSDEEYNKL
jgi:quercetin dioxygenase-like cupin family protein